MSNIDLAERINLSPSPCLRRVKRLEADGVITGYHARIDPKAVGQGTEVLVNVEMGVKTKAVADALEARLVDCPEVIELRRMFGLPDYLVRIAVADLEAAENFISNTLTAIEGVARVESHLTMRVLKRPYVD